MYFSYLKQLSKRGKIRHFGFTFLNIYILLTLVSIIVGFFEKEGFTSTVSLITAIILLLLYKISEGEIDKVMVYFTKNRKPRIKKEKKLKNNGGIGGNHIVRKPRNR